MFVKNRTKCIFVCVLMSSWILGLFEKCKYEIAMLKSTSRVHYQDLHAQLEKALREANRGQLAPSTCIVCDLKFNSQLTLFRLVPKLNLTTKNCFSFLSSFPVYWIGLYLSLPSFEVQGDRAKPLPFNIKQIIRIKLH